MRAMRPGRRADDRGGRLGHTPLRHATAPFQAVLPCADPLDRAVRAGALNSGHFWAPDLPYKRSDRITVSYLGAIEPGLEGAEFTRRSQALLERARRDAFGELSEA